MGDIIIARISKKGSSVIIKNGYLLTDPLYPEVKKLMEELPVYTVHHEDGNSNKPSYISKGNSAYNRYGILLTKELLDYPFKFKDDFFNGERSLNVMLFPKGLYKKESFITMDQLLQVFHKMREPEKSSYAKTEESNIFIRKAAYELYKIDWMKRITRDMEMDAVRNYYEESMENGNEDYSLEEYIFDIGYGNGCIYVCYDEFLNAEYLDQDYMKELFNNDKLYKKYQKDIVNQEQTEISANFKDLLLKLIGGRSIRETAKDTDVAASYICSMVKGQYVPSIKICKKLTMPSAKPQGGVTLMDLIACL